MSHKFQSFQTYNRVTPTTRCPTSANVRLGLLKSGSLNSRVYTFLPLLQSPVVLVHFVFQIPRNKLFCSEPSPLESGGSQGTGVGIDLSGTCRRRGGSWITISRATWGLSCRVCVGTGVSWETGAPCGLSCGNRWAGGSWDAGAPWSALGIELSLIGWRSEAIGNWTTLRLELSVYVGGGGSWGIGAPLGLSCRV